MDGLRATWLKRERECPADKWNQITALQTGNTFTIEHLQSGALIKLQKIPHNYRLLMLAAFQNLFMMYLVQGNRSIVLWFIKPYLCNFFCIFYEQLNTHVCNETKKKSQTLNNFFKQVIKYCLFKLTALIFYLSQIFNTMPKVNE